MQATCEEGASLACVPVDSLPLSNRTRTRLLDAGIETAQDLMAASDEELLALRGFGNTCLREVHSVLRALRDQRGAKPVVAASDAFPADVPAHVLDLPIHHLPLPNRARRVFSREGIDTVRDYVNRGEEGLLGLRNFGVTTYSAVNRAIHTACQAGATDARAPWIRDPDAIAFELDQELATVPVAVLDLPRRARRACQEMGVRTLRDLAALSSDDMLVRRNFGQATLRRIRHEVERFVERRFAPEADDFEAVLDDMLSRLQDKERTLVELREGILGAPVTLTEAGRELKITESRSCQIEHAAWTRLRRFAAAAARDAGDRATRFLLESGGVRATEELAGEPYFHSRKLPPIFVARMLAKLLPHRIALLEDGRLVAVPGATLSVLEVRLRKRLRRGRESVALGELTREVTRGIELESDAGVIVRALCEVLFQREVTPGPDGELLVRTPAQGLGDDLRAVLIHAGGPLHFREIARRLRDEPFVRTDASDEKVRLRLCRDSRFVLIRRGLYDLVERFEIDPTLRREASEFSLRVLRETARPTSVAFLGARLRRDPRFAGINEFVLAALLRSDERFRHLGRGSFVPADAPPAGVERVSEMLEDILRSAGRALPYAELKRRVQERRQVSDGAISATLVGRDQFMRVDRGVFDLAERLPFGEELRRRIRDRAGEILMERGGACSLVELRDCLLPLLPTPAPGPVLIGDLLRRSGGLRPLPGGFVYLPDPARERELEESAERCLRSAGEPLRPTTIARRLGLSPGQAALLRQLLKESDRFASRKDGRFALRRER